MDFALLPRIEFHRGPSGFELTFVSHCQIQKLPTFTIFWAPGSVGTKKSPLSFEEARSWRTLNSLVSDKILAITTIEDTKENVVAGGVRRYGRMVSTFTSLMSDSYKFLPVLIYNHRLSSTIPINIRNGQSNVIEKPYYRKWLVLATRGMRKAPLIMTNFPFSCFDRVFPSHIPLINRQRANLWTKRAMLQTWGGWWGKRWEWWEGR